MTLGHYLHCLLWVICLVGTFGGGAATIVVAIGATAEEAWDRWWVIVAISLAIHTLCGAALCAGLKP